MVAAVKILLELGLEYESYSVVLKFISFVKFHYCNKFCNVLFFLCSSATE